MTYAFHFDSTYCSGCKACQAACKDKNQLPVGVLWRRVIEVSGGEWQRNGATWNNTVFSYNLSISCNHCVHPKCAGVCPVDAYNVRDDGIVILDSSKCVGCGYCAWACPYGAPQYNPQAGYMTKCDFCHDKLDQGMPPACVAACPLRVLDYGEDTVEQGIALWDVSPEEHPFPLPGYSHTQPRLAIQPHPAMNVAEEKSVANLEEIQPRTPSSWDEVPLVIFTLLGQLAVGGFWVLWMWTDRLMPTLRLIPHLIISTSLGVGLLASFAHLGTRRNAWRVLAHLSHSWLSREILFAGLFGLGWLSTVLLSATRHPVAFEAAAITSILGIGLVYSMGQVYRIPAAPGWNSPRTNAGFLVSAVLLGMSAMTPILTLEADLAGILIPPTLWKIAGVIILLCLLTQLAMIQRRVSDVLGQSMRIAMIFFAVVLTVVGILNLFGSFWLSALTFLIVLLEEILGRWLFYRSRL